MVLGRAVIIMLNIFIQFLYLRFLVRILSPSNVTLANL